MGGVLAQSLLREGAGRRQIQVDEAGHLAKMVGGLRRRYADDR